MSNLIPKPQYKIGDIIIGRAHPKSAETRMCKIISGYFNQYGHWTYICEYSNETIEIVAQYVDYKVNK